MKWCSNERCCTRITVITVHMVRMAVQYDFAILKLIEDVV